MVFFLGGGGLLPYLKVMSVVTIIMGGGGGVPHELLTLLHSLGPRDSSCTFVVLQL